MYIYICIILYSILGKNIKQQSKVHVETSNPTRYRIMVEADLSRVLVQWSNGLDEMSSEVRKFTLRVTDVVSHSFNSEISWKASTKNPKIDFSTPLFLDFFIDSWQGAILELPWCLPQLSHHRFNSGLHIGLPNKTWDWLKTSGWENGCQYQKWP